MKLETWIYKQALELYPKAYREQFGEPMLATYTDGLRAAKLEGKTWRFHWNTVLDTVKSVSRATMDVKNANPTARITAVIGLFTVIMALMTYFPQTRGLVSVAVINSIGACFIIGLAMVSKHFVEVRQKWLLPSFATLVVVKAAIFAFVNLFHADSLTAFSVPEVNLGASIGIVILGHIFKAIPMIGAGLFGVAMVLDFLQTRKINIVYLFVLTQVLVMMLVFALQGFFPKGTFWSFAFAIQISFNLGTLLFLLFICLRLWQQPRVIPNLRIGTHREVK